MKKKKKRINTLLDSRYFYHLVIYPKEQLVGIHKVNTKRNNLSLID